MNPARELQLISDLTQDEKTEYAMLMVSQRKDKATMFILTLFLGGIGVHHFYMGNSLSGILYLLFCWTFVPVVLSFFELFLAFSYVDGHNAKLALKIVKMIKSQRNQTLSILPNLALPQM